jgi:hypothetical protein
VNELWLMRASYFESKKKQTHPLIDIEWDFLILMFLYILKVNSVINMMFTFHYEDLLYHGINRFNSRNVTTALLKTFDVGSFGEKSDSVTSIVTGTVVLKSGFN